MITIHLPEDLERSLHAEVESGRFASVSDAIAEAARRLLDELEEGRPDPTPSGPETGPVPVPGGSHQADDELGEIVARAEGLRERIEGKSGESATATPRPAHKPIWEVADELRKTVPEEEWAKLPPDGAAQLDHYIYGSPKRPPSLDGSLRMPITGSPCSTTRIRDTRPPGTSAERSRE